MRVSFGVSLTLHADIRSCCRIFGSGGIESLADVVLYAVQALPLSTAFQAFLVSMNTSALRGSVYDGNGTCVISSMLLGLVSLYTGLFGAGAKPTVVGSAVRGTFSLVLAMAYVLQ